MHLRTIDEAVENYRTLSDQLLKDDLDADSAEGERARAAVAQEIVATKTREFDTLGVVLGSRYDTSPIVLDDGSAAPAEHYANYQPSAHPGCLAPHAWLNDGSSLYDHFGLGYTLLLLDDSAAVLAQEIEDAALDAGVPLARLDLRGAKLDALYAAPLALIRPDQFVAWRGSDADPSALVGKISGKAAEKTTESETQKLEIRGDKLRNKTLESKRLGRVAL